MDVRQLRVLSIRGPHVDRAVRVFSSRFLIERRLAAERACRRAAGTAWRAGPGGTTEK